MKYKVQYSCLSHIGNHRKINQDNFICNGILMDPENEALSFPLQGSSDLKSDLIVGVFDGMGGEDCGEVASLIAAKAAAELSLGSAPIDALRNYCTSANEEICQYTETHEIFSTGTTAAILAFTADLIYLFNIGDSRIFRFSDSHLAQISIDHVAVSAHGTKPPLSQNIGIPPEEMTLDPYIAKGTYQDGDVFLICSDGLTDMVPNEIIEKTLTDTTFEETSEALLSLALSNGGRDNITMILCRVQRDKTRWFDRLLHKNTPNHGGTQK